MESFIYQNWHYWKANNSYLLSNEDTKQLLSFKCTDDAVNYLFLNGYKDAARELNKHYKKEK